ncbi:putative WWE domain-containing protein [Rosa chinensis]|uniref:Putative WWE domain-containing protein n=1 Tax=Rosa chinensis TaxID=74649 RepID=A0A2P6RG58_ROSCH|nr:putative WWE domain-containing protein [Rosa chinensis]
MRSTYWYWRSRCSPWSSYGSEFVSDLLEHGLAPGGARFLEWVELVSCSIRCHQGMFEFPFGF